MPDIYDDFTTQEKTSSVLDSNRLVNFAYDDTAFSTDDAEGRDIYDYNANNNIPKKPLLPDSVQTGGFNGTSGVFKRSFWNHYAGRISYNLNKAVQALKNLLSSFRSDYSENISEYSQYAGYNIGDVCYRLSGDTITFYRCKARIAEPAGTFNGVYWEKPEEELSHNRPRVGVPVLWFEKVPDDKTLGAGKGWAIRFDDGAHYTWEQCPSLNFEDFRSLVTLTSDGFTVPDYTGKVPMFAGGANAVKSGYRGDSFTAALENHAHTAPALTFTIPSVSQSHTHPDAASTTAGNHQHEINNRCNYDGHENTSKLPVDDVNSYNPATLTTSAGSHSHSETSSGAGIGDHTHAVTISGNTGAVKGTTGGNPDSFQCCWIVRYR